MFKKPCQSVCNYQEKPAGQPWPKMDCSKMLTKATFSLSQTLVDVARRWIFADVKLWLRNKRWSSVTDIPLERMQKGHCSRLLVDLPSLQRGHWTAVLAGGCIRGCNLCHLWSKNQSNPPQSTSDQTLEENSGWFSPTMWIGLCALTS